MLSLLQRRPDSDPWFIVPVVSAWWDEYQSDPDNMNLPMAVEGTKFRASWAGDCSRSLAYKFAGIDVSNPITFADAWRFNIGTLLHEHVQRSILAAFPGSEAELKIKLRDVNGSSHLDVSVVRPSPDGEVIRTAVEVKSINGTGFRMMMGPKREPLRYKFVLQGALSAFSMDPMPDELLIAVFCLELMSPAEMKKSGITDEISRFAAQWTFKQDEFVPIAQREIARVNGIMRKTAEQGPESIRRIIPDPSLGKHIVTDPRKGFVEFQDPNGLSTGLGHTWHCGYCGYRDRCAQDMDYGDATTVEPIEDKPLPMPKKAITA